MASFLQDSPLRCPICRLRARLWRWFASGLRANRRSIRRKSLRKPWRESRAGPCPGLGLRALGDWLPYGCHSERSEESRSALKWIDAQGGLWVGGRKNRARFLAALGMTPGGLRPLAECRNFRGCPKGRPYIRIGTLPRSIAACGASWLALNWKLGENSWKFVR